MPPRLPTTGDRIPGPWLDNWPYRITCMAVLLLLCALLPGQVVRVEAQQPFEGWCRATIGTKPKHPTGVVTAPNGDVTPYVLGRAIGLDTWVVDLRVHLAAGERASLDLATALPATLPPFPVTPDRWFGWLGGLPEFAGVPMALVPGSLAADGAAVTSHWRCRVPPMFVADFFCRWHGEPWMHGELVLTASNPAVPALGAQSGLWPLRFGDAKVSAPGITPELAALSLIEPGTWFGDGQARALPVTLHWTRHGGSAPGAVHACGDVRLWPDGNPQVLAGLDVLAWVGPKLEQARARLHTWDPMVVGVNKASGDTGEQQEQLATCGEFVLHERASTLTYLSALKFANRPCHHRERDGSLLDYLGHLSPRLVIWDGRPHWSAVVSPDRLGKAAGTLDANGWFGPDVEHAMHSTLAAGARLTGSPALQAELGAIARVYLFQWTIAPGLSTSQPFAARAVGWEGILCTHLWRTLEDRALAQRVADRWRARFDAFAWMLDDLDVRTDDPRLGPGKRWIPWQQAIGAWGLDLAGRVLDRPAACAIALQHAHTILADAYVWRNNRWTTRDVVALDGAETTTGFFDLFGCPLAPQLVLRREPGNAKAQEIVGQVRAEAVQEKQARWLVPR